MLFQITTAGRGLIDANALGPQITRVDFGDSFNYALANNPTGLDGTLVYSSNTVYAAQVADANTLKYRVFLAKEVASFTFGEIALFSNSTLVGVGVAAVSIDKVGPSGDETGETFALDVYISTFTGQRYAVVEVATSRIVNSFPRVPIPDLLTPPALNENNAYVIYSPDATEVSYLAFADPNGKWSFSAKPQVHFTGTVSSVGQLSLTTLDIVGAYENAITDLVLEFASGPARGYCRQLTDFVSEDGIIQWLTPLLMLPNAGDDFIIVGPQTSTQVISTGQANIQWKDEGINLGSPGTATSVDFVGSNVTATRSGNAITVTITPGTGQTPIQFQEEGTNLGSTGTANVLNFVGPNITATRSGNTVTVTTTSAQSPFGISDEGSVLGTVGTVDNINFVGAGVSASRSGNTVTVTVSNGGNQSGIQWKDEGTNLGTSGTVDVVNFVGSGVTSSRTSNTVTVNIPAQQQYIGVFDEETEILAPGDLRDLIFTGPGVVATDAGGGQALVTIRDWQENLQLKVNGTNLGSQGTATSIDITGAGVTANRTGDAVTYSITSSTGTIGVHAIPIVSGSMRPTFNNGCSILTPLNSAPGVSYPDILTLDFDASTEESAWFFVPMPERWNRGTIGWKAIWSHATTATNFAVSWALCAVAQSAGETFSGVPFGTRSIVLSTSSGTAETWTHTSVGTMTVGNAPADGDVVTFRITRQAADGADNLAVDARLHAIVLYVTTDAETDA